MRFRFLGHASILLAILTSCGSAQFFGSGSRSNNDSPSGNPSDPANPNAGGTNNPNGGSTPGGTGNPGGSNPGGTYPGGTGNPGTPAGPGVPGAPGYPTIPGSPTYPGSTNCPGTRGSPCGPAQVPQIGGPGEVQTTPNGVVFGKDRVFHIGNGRFEASTCREEIEMLPLSGSIYFFQFEVTADNTQVNVNVAKACGIDFSTGTLQLSSSGRQVTAAPILAGMTSLTIPQVTLNRGVYTIYVYSGKSDGTRAPSWDIDDFVVGQVQINATQPIRPGSYGTYR